MPRNSGNPLMPDHPSEPMAAVFLDFLEKDIVALEGLAPVDPDLVASIQSLVDGVEIDLDAPLSYGND